MRPWRSCWRRTRFQSRRHRGNGAASPQSRWCILIAANLHGVARTAQVARILLAATLLTLAIVLVVAYGSHERAADPWYAHGGAFGVLQAAGLLFFASAGYARIATLAEEYRDPSTSATRSCSPSASR